MITPHPLFLACRLIASVASSPLRLLRVPLCATVFMEAALSFVFPWSAYYTAEALELSTADRDWLLERIGQQREREAREIEKAGRRR